MKVVLPKERGDQYMGIKSKNLKLNKALSILLSLSVIASSLLTPAYASMTGVGSGGGVVGGVTGKGSYNMNRCGYRISIVDTIHNLINLIELHFSKTLYIISKNKKAILG